MRSFQEPHYYINLFKVYIQEQKVNLIMEILELKEIPLMYFQVMRIMGLEFTFLVMK